MLMTKSIITIVGMSLIVGALSTAALAVSKRTAATATRDVSQLVKMMDKDQNGSVSKEEFMDFMSQTFDRLDVNKSGALEPNELRPMSSPTLQWLRGGDRQNPPPS
jgi:Ca2+-binding EF-hand superfamily protein